MLTTGMSLSSGMDYVRWMATSRHKRWSVGIAAIGLLLTACSDPWLVVKAGKKTQFVGKTSFAFEGVSFVDTKVDGTSEQTYIDSGGDLVELWQRGKVTFSKRYSKALPAELKQRGISLGTGPAIVLKLEEIVVGELYTVDSNPNYIRTHVTATIAIEHDGYKSDLVRIERSAHGFATKPIELRFGSVGDQLAAATAEFVAAQTAP